jgi:tryptophan synthase alpha subunit
MNNLDKKLKEIRQRKKIGIMGHVVVGYPNISETITIVKTLVDARVDIVELQIPFSDPLADGPTIMRACEKALENGTKVKDAFVVMKKLSSELSTPLLFMAYYNTVFNYGVEKFCRDAKKAGASGLIVPDMPIDEEKEEGYYVACKKNNLHAIHVVSPVSTLNRLQKNAKVATGFVYSTARQGITGAKKDLDPAVISYLDKMKQHFSIPVAVGFGISNKEHIDLLKKNADIAIVGSAVIDIINQSPKEKLHQNISRFFEELVIQ